MGLDCFWMKDGKRLDIDEAHSEHIVGETYSDQGCGSFRGEHYGGIVEALTGQSLYENIDSEKVGEMAAVLGSHEYQDSWQEKHAIKSKEEWVALVHMFQVYANKGASLHAWC